MSTGRLTPLQVRALEVLTQIEPRGRLVGGAAIAGFITCHRQTRDLDLFWYERPELGALVRDTELALRDAGFVVESTRSAPAFHQFRVRLGQEELVIDLVAEPFAPLAPPLSVTVGAVTVSVESPEELLAAKLCTLLERQEVRDLTDVRALLDAGGDLASAMKNAPQKDAGFSPVTLAWVLRDFPVQRLALASGTTEGEASALASFRDRLVDQCIDLSLPDSAP